MIFILYEKQKYILDFIKNGSLLPLGTGTGKTIISLWHYFKNHYPTPLIIICPAAKFNEGGWDREIELIASKFNVKIPDYTVISYDRAKNLELKKNKFFFIIDEAHYIKNPTAIRSRIVRKYLKNNSTDFILLTATPGTKIEDFVNYFIIWNFVKNKTEFYKNYIIRSITHMGFKQFYQITSYQNKEDFKEKLLSKCTPKLTVNDMVEMKPINEINIYFNPYSKYKKIKRERVFEINNETYLLDTQAKLCSILRQYCNVTDKIEYLKMIVEKMTTADNLLIFYNYNSELERITQAIKVDYVINGKIKNYPKKNEFEKQKNKITLVQIQAGGTGIELQYNNLVVFYSPTYSYQDYEQAIGRAYRNGQKNKVIMYKFNTKNTIEFDVWNALDNKKDFNEKLWKGD